MTVKANCHQVDCDKATGDGGSWTSDQYGIPTFVGGIYNIGHCYILGIDYDVLYEGVGTGAFDRGCDIHPTSQKLYWGAAITDGNSDAIFVYNNDGTQDTSVSYTVGDNYSTWFKEENLILRFSHDATVIYGMWANSTRYIGRLYAWDVASGNLLWEYPESGAVTESGYGVVGSGLFITNDSRILVADISVDVYNQYRYTFLNSDGSVESTATYIGDRFRQHTVFYNNVIYTAGGNETVASNGASFTHTSRPQSFIVEYRGYIYVAGNKVDTQNDCNVFKLNPTDLSVIAKYECDPGFGSYNNLVTMNVAPDGEGIICFVQDKTDGTLEEPDGWYELDLDLQLKNEGYMDLYGLASYQIRYAQFYPSPWIVNGGAISSAISSQYRSVAYPQDYAHIEGQTVQVLEDGIYIGDYVVTGGAVTI